MRSDNGLWLPDCQASEFVQRGILGVVKLGWAQETPSHRALHKVDICPSSDNRSKLNAQ